MDLLRLIQLIRDVWAAAKLECLSVVDVPEECVVVVLVECLVVAVCLAELVADVVQVDVAVVECKETAEDGVVAAAQVVSRVCRVRDT